MATIKLKSQRDANTLVVKRIHRKSRTRLLLVATTLALLIFPALASQRSKSPGPSASTTKAADQTVTSRSHKRWLFIFRDLTNPAEVDRMIARFPQAQAAGYNGVVCSFNVAKEKAAEVRQAAKKYGLEIIATVFGGAHDRNYVEGVPVKDTPFVVHGATASHEAEGSVELKNGDFESTNGDKFTGWAWQDDIGVTTFADHDVVHGGKTSLRMESIGKNANGLCRVHQPIKLKPHRQYRVSFWIKTDNLRPAIPEMKVLTDTPQGCISWQTFHAEATQGWKQVDLVFNSLDESAARIYLGFWGGKSGKIWWDDLKVEEIGLVNAIRRPGCPITVRSENGTEYVEWRDFEKIVDPQFHPWIAYRGSEPKIKLTANSRITEGERLLVSYYHPIIVYEDRVTFCLSEPKVFDDWRAEVKLAEELLHPAGYFMSHDELRCMNQCGQCRSMKMTAGELLAWNVKKAAAIIREARPDASIWVWNDMFDPLHNATEHFYAVNGTLSGSWKGLDKDVGIVNWHGGLKGKNCKFFADLGLKQILSGYYDGDEDGAAIKEWYNATTTVPGIVGAMYTTWEDKYGAMSAWAQKAWGGIK
jgi:hypothetical protein